VLKAPVRVLKTIVDVRAARKVKRVAVCEDLLAYFGLIIEIARGDVRKR
jgi:hypothetical protein